MKEAKSSEESEPLPNGKHNKGELHPAAQALSDKVRVFINREKQSLRGSLKTIVRKFTNDDTEHLAPRALIGRKSPDFKATAVFGEEFKEIQLSDYEGKYVLLFFYPLDFTFVCPTELHAFQERLSEFKKRGVEVLACSVDSKFSHFNWLKVSKDEGGIKGVRYGLISDLGGRIAHDYGVLSDEGIAYRALFLLDQKGVVRHQLINDLSLGRSVDEALRTVDALQHVEKHGEVCPANWKRGEKAMSPTPEGVAEYMSGPTQ